MAKLRVEPRRGIIQRLLSPIGEISALRGNSMAGWDFKYSSQYTLDSTRVNYDLARNLYRNIEDKYKLGAGFAKPVVNTAAGFMGAPHFTHVNPEADRALEADMSRWVGKILRINRNALRDGDVFARITREPTRFDAKEDAFELVLVPPEWVTPIPDPLTGGWLELIIKHPVRVLDSEGREQNKFTVIERLTPKHRTIEADGNAPAELREKNGQTVNPWGFIPLVHFRNEAEEHQVYGASELEPIEPFLKAYHDTMLFAVQGSKLFSRPKAKFSLKDVESFLANNFTDQEIRSGKLKFADKEIFLMQEGDDASFITADSGLNGITTLLKFLFYCIVDVSETPEFAFGTAVASSKASVSEQMTPLSRKIRRKRGLFEEPYGELSGMLLAMNAKIKNKKLETNRVKVNWDELSPKNDQEVASTIKTLVEGLVTAIESGLLSTDSAADFLREFVPTMLPFANPDADDDERRRVVKSMLWRKRVEDGEGWDKIEEPANSEHGVE